MWNIDFIGCSQIRMAWSPSICSATSVSRFRDPSGLPPPGLPGLNCPLCGIRTAATACLARPGAIGFFVAETHQDPLRSPPRRDGGAPQRVVDACLPAGPGGRKVSTVCECSGHSTLASSLPPPIFTPLDLPLDCLAHEVGAILVFVQDCLDPRECPRRESRNHILAPPLSPCHRFPPHLGEVIWRRQRHLELPAGRSIRGAHARRSSGNAVERLAITIDWGVFVVPLDLGPGVVMACAALGPFCRGEQAANNRPGAGSKLSSKLSSL